MFITLDEREHNMALWIHNDEDLYFMAHDLITMIGHEEAAKEMRRRLRGRTPDGIKWSYYGIHKAILAIEA